MALAIEVLPRIPAKVTGTDGITVAKRNGSMVVGFDYQASGFGAELQQAIDASSGSATSAATAQAAAEAAQAAAEAAAGSLTFATEQQAQEGAVGDHGMSPLLVQQSKLGVQTADSLAAADTVNIATITNVLMVHGNTDPGDGPPAPYVSRLSEPSHSGKTYINGKWYELERHDGVYLEDFGGVNASNGYGTVTSGVDNSSALADAIDYCFKKRRAVVRINSGVWPCSEGGFEIPVGISLQGHGFSSSLPGGSVLQANYNEATSTNPFLAWTGAGAAYNGTGGGIQNLTVQKGAAKTGGALIKITGADDTMRPGYMVFQNVKVSGTNQGADCDIGIIHDGSNLTTTNTNGIRDVAYSNVWVDGWKVIGAQLINATHTKIVGMTFSPTGDALDCIRITGNDSNANSKTTSLMAIGLECYGNIILDNINFCHIICRTTDLVITGNVTKSVIVPIVESNITFAGTIGGNATTRENLRLVNQTRIIDYRDDALYTGGGNTKVVGTRASGWSTSTGTATRSGFVTSTVTLPQLAERVKALIDDLHATAGHGLIGS